MLPQTIARLEQAAGKPDERQVNRRISARIKRACAALVDGEAQTLTQAAAIAKIRREQVSIALNKPHVVAYLKERACRALAIASGRAAAVKVGLLESPSEHVRNDASTFILGVNGMRPNADTQVNVSIDIKAGYVIDLSDAPSMRHTPTIDGKALETKGINGSDV